MSKEKLTASAVSVPAKTYQRRARNILIHKPMQREFTLMLMALLMVATLAIGFVIHSTIREVAFGNGYQFGKISPYEILSDLSYLLTVRVCIVLFVTLIIVGFYGVFFLHRVAGPVYRFRRVFMRLNDGEISNPIKLREGDFFLETAEEINRLMERMKSEGEKRDRMKEKLNQVLSTHPNDPVGKAAQELKGILEQAPGKG